MLPWNRSEEQFIRAIAKDPRDSANRMAYADWLEERGDLRCHVLRVEEEMSRVAVTSDRYWELKPRRDAMRDASEPAWIERIKCLRAWRPIFAEPVTDRRGKWRQVRAFVELWGGERVGDVNETPAEVSTIEAELGATLPVSVHEWISLCVDLGGVKRRRFTPFERVFRDDFGLQWVPGERAIALLTQAEGDVFWAVKECDLSNPDPPVHRYLWNYELDRAEYDALDGSDVASFVVRHASWYLETPGGGFTCPLNRHQREALSATQPAVWSSDHFAIFDFPQVVIFVERSPWAEEWELRVNALHPLRFSELPSCLHELRGCAGGSYGDLGEQFRNE